MHYRNMNYIPTPSKKRESAIKTMGKSTLIIYIMGVLIVMLALFSIVVASKAQAMANQIDSLQSQLESMQKNEDPTSSNLLVFDSVPYPIMEIPAPAITLFIDEADQLITANSVEGTEPILDEAIPKSTPEPTPEPLPINTQDITSPSNLSASQLNDMIHGTLQAYGYIDNRTMLKNTGDILYQAEQTYQINALYILSVATWEGGWGTSWAALNKNNPFGLYGSNSLMRFSSVEEGILDFSRRMREYYFDCGRTDPYAIGKKYCPGNATTWGNKISIIMDMYAAHI